MVEGKDKKKGQMPQLTQGILAEIGRWELDSALTGARMTYCQDGAEDREEKQHFRS